VALLLCACGCQQSASVNGTASYDGKPIENGAVTFMPVDGHGPTFGARIRDGRYEVENAHLGKSVARVEGIDVSNTPKSTEELIKKSIEADPEQYTAFDYVPLEAIGNMQEVEIQPGAQTIDFKLKPPASK
jgi:hypothetical protein